MSSALSEFYNNCDPGKYAQPNQYIDSDDARGSRDLTKQFQSDLKNVSKGFLCFLFTGHTGCGKSSELRHLAETLKNPDLQKNDPAFFPIYMDAEEFIDSYDAEPTDILLSIFAAAARQLKEVGIELKDNFLWRRLSNLKELLFSDVDLKEVGVSLAAISAKFNVLKSDPANRKLVREALGKDITPLKQEIQLQFEKARNSLVKKKAENGQPYKDFVLILDNLEKIERVKGKEDGYISQRHLFITCASQLMDLGAHVVYTTPLTLVINDGDELQNIYGSPPFVLPMIKVEKRPVLQENYTIKRESYSEGIETLTKLVEKRLPVNTQRKDLIDDDALEFILQYSGGHTRQLIMFLRRAVTQVDEAPITLKAAHLAIADTVALMSNSSYRYLDELVELELSEDRKIDISSDACKDMVRKSLVLEYRNAGHDSDAFNPTAPWYGVHPIVRELNPFKNLLQTKREELQKDRDNV
jgi:energy-coupling factor transporter ATP-binding protein EcfA2